jgi:hypothetical protein
MALVETHIVMDSPVHREIHRHGCLSRHSAAGASNDDWPRWSALPELGCYGTVTPDFFSAGGSAGATWSGVHNVGFSLLAWTLPQIAANVVGGSLSFSGSDAIGAAAAGRTASLAAASFVSSRSQDTEASKTAVSAAQSAATTAASVGVQAGMAATTGGLRLELLRPTWLVRYMASPKRARACCVRCRAVAPGLVVRARTWATGSREGRWQTKWRKFRVRLRTRKQVPSWLVTLGMNDTAN